MLVVDLLEICEILKVGFICFALQNSSTVIVGKPEKIYNLEDDVKVILKRMCGFV
jgi:hypothetical protein